MSEKSAPTRMQRSLSATLRSGVLVATATGLLGGSFFLTRHGDGRIHFDTFTGARSPFASPNGIIYALFGGDDAIRWLAVVQIGIVILLLTPIVRVALSLVGFAIERDRSYVFITAIVLLTLLSSVAMH